MKYRNFGGKRYRLADTTITKSAAMDAACSFRKRGDNARISKSGLGYGVYVRDTAQRRKALGYK